jgi:hypothetical protein
MINQVEETLKELWSMGATPILIQITIKDYFELKQETVAKLATSYEQKGDIATLFGVPVYKTKETGTSNIMAVYDDFLTAFRLISGK